MLSSHYLTIGLKFYFKSGNNIAIFSSYPKSTIKRCKSLKCKFTFENLQQFFRENGEKKCVCRVLAAKTGLNGDYLRKRTVLLEQHNNVTADDYERLLI